MSRFARRQLQSKTIDLLTVDDVGNPELLRVTIRRIDNAQAAEHGLQRLLVMGEAARQRPAHTPEPVRRAQHLASRLKGVRSDLAVYSEEKKEGEEGEVHVRGPAVVAAREAIEAVDIQLAEAHAAAPDDDAPTLSRQEKQAAVEAAYLSTGHPAGLIRLLLTERDLLHKLRQAEHEVTLIHSGRMVGIARQIGSAGTKQGALQRAAIVCAAVTHFQTLVVAPGVTAPDVDVPEHWTPHPDEPQPERVQLVQTGEADEASTPKIYPLAVLTSSEVSTIAEAAYLHAVGGEQGKAALERFRQQSKADGRDVAAESGQGDHRG